MTSSDSNLSPRPTPLHTLHTEWGGKMTDFAGYHLPLSYNGRGFIAEHLHTREKASLFDVSHMGQFVIGGNNHQQAAEALSQHTPAIVADIPQNTAKYACLTLDNGGVLDDFIIGNDGERGWFTVFNASRKETDVAHLRARMPSSCNITELENWGLVALQGPMAEKAAAALIPQLASLSFMQSMWFDFEGESCRAARGGYTGEDGFEFSLPPNVAESFTRQLCQHEAVAPAGLGARDSLRMEAGLCLYGNELDENTSPVEAGLTWSIPKSRRSGGDYAGADIIARQIRDGAPRRLVGLRPQGKKVPRAHAVLQNTAGTETGAVTSGLHSPVLQSAIALGYVRTEDATADSMIAVVRGEQVECAVCKPPFVKHQYKKGA